MWIDMGSYVFLPSCLPHAHPRRQVSDIANGLSYLHSHDVIHGVIAGVSDCSKCCSAAMLTPVQRNILVDGSGHARIAGFGHTTVTQDLDSAQSTPHSDDCCLRWPAPELCKWRDTKEGDIFSFAMVMVEVRHGRSIVQGSFGLTAVLRWSRYLPVRFRLVRLLGLCCL